MKVLVAYATAHNSTAEMAEFIGRILRAYSLDVTVKNVENISTVKDYDVVVMGSAVHAGMWLPQLSQFIVRCQDRLKERRTFLFLTCIRVLEEGGLEHVLENYIHKPTLEELKIEEVAVFPGRIKQDAIDGDERWLLVTNYDGYRMPGNYDRDYRNWQEAAAWASHLTEVLDITPQFDESTEVKKKKPEPTK